MFEVIMSILTEKDIKTLIVTGGIDRKEAVKLLRKLPEAPSDSAKMITAIDLLRKKIDDIVTGNNSDEIVSALSGINRTLMQLINAMKEHDQKPPKKIPQIDGATINRDHRGYIDSITFTYKGQ